MRMQTLVLAGIVVAGWESQACGGDDTERAALSARLAGLQEEVRRLGETVTALKANAKPPTAAGPQAPVFKLTCPQPWIMQIPVGASLWTCRSPTATPQGVYPQCSVIVQPQISIETKDYFEFATQAAPQLREIKDFKDKHTKLNAADSFEATFTAELTPVAQTMLGALIPHGETTYAVTCAAPSAEFTRYTAAFRRIIDTFAFN
jgi:hypothetical protein